MHRSWAAALLWWVATAPSSIHAQAAPTNAAEDHATPLVVGHRLSIHSTILDEDRSILVSLPDDSRPGDGAVPVIYVLDGRVHFLHTVATVDLLSRLDRMPRSIVVGIANPDRGRDLRATAAPGRTIGGADRFLDFIESELIPFVESNLSAGPHRTLIGHSLGASFVLHTLVERPDLFDAAVAISPAVSGEEGAGVGRTPLSRRMRIAFENREVQRFSLYISMSDGEGFDWETDLAAVTAVIDSEAPREFEWTFEMMEGEDHGTTVHPSTYRGLRFINRDWAELTDVRTCSLLEFQDRFEAVSKRLGTEVRPPEVLVNLLGYRLLGEGRTDAAIETFEYNRSLYPESANVHDSLGEALERQGKLPGAMRNYRKAVVKAETEGDRRVEIYRENLARVEAVLLEQGSAGGSRGETALRQNPDGGGIRHPQ